MTSCVCVVHIQVKRSGKKYYYVDAHDETTSNWMRWINCPRHFREENVEVRRIGNEEETGWNWLLGSGRLSILEMGIHLPLRPPTSEHTNRRTHVAFCLKMNIDSRNTALWLMA